ncbi:hypothetical protein [Methylobacter sp. YRD-M1]|uniref:hypothetical protein n=1 Tax=Methylobacter sp. YRD-M1 TaxID=2911520 RepID=UPI00227BABB0|nr:hypothetical protein [Methylobacter sp. YRD-M1]WAK01328.1 hypothetical protein LZ558_16050 [Methylobacter sp. YRD-M1]
MNDKRKSSLKVALHGMDGRTYKTMVMYLQGPCKGAAAVVDDLDAEVDIIDADSINAKALLEQKLTENSSRPIIVLSLQELKLDNALYVRKPIKTVEILDVLSKAEALLASKQKTSENVQINKKLFINTDERRKTSKHQTAMHLDEGNFNAFIGSIPGLDVNDPKQFSNASYNPKEYFQGYFQSACLIAQTKKQVLHLNSGWKSLIIFPHNHEIWFDADDKQLRSFAGLPIKSLSGAGMSLTPASAHALSANKELDKFHNVDAFLWKLAVWSSRGRYPVALDIDRPVFLKHWPNFTRLIVTPHALRISALLIAGPRTLPDIAETLKIKPQYVFVFISAAHALGLVKQAKRQSDEIIQPPAIKKNTERQGLLTRILSKLRANKS